MFSIQFRSTSKYTFPLQQHLLASIRTPSLGVRRRIFAILDRLMHFGSVKPTIIDSIKHPKYSSSAEKLLLHVLHAHTKGRFSGSGDFKDTFDGT